MKKFIAALVAIICMAIPAVVMAATPEWNQTYYSTTASSKHVALDTYSSKVHGINESNWGGYVPPEVGKCNAKYAWTIGWNNREAGGNKRPIPVTAAGYWSATRVNQVPNGTETQTGNIPKVTVTGHFTSKTNGVGTWKVHGCTKHSFKFVIAQPGGGA